jgi:Glycosyl hydrolase catalytic core
MPLRRRGAILVLIVGVLGIAPPAAAKVPNRFFGIAPQNNLNEVDTAWMRHGGLETIRVPLPWSFLQPSGGPVNWAPMDAVVAEGAKANLEIFPFVYSTPSWVASKPTRLPVDTRRQRRAWTSFLRAAVGRYGPSGRFWREHGRGSADPLPKVPIRHWQIWNEANFHYFALPASPRRYGRLLKLSHAAITSVAPRAGVVLSGLFAEPQGRYPRAMPAVRFLRRLFRIDGIRGRFDAVAVHPYAANARKLRRVAQNVRRVMVRTGNRRKGLWITEMGWGSQEGSNVSFEKGEAGQARELRRAYSYLTSRSRRLNLKRTYWFSWKDAEGPSCSFCDSVGLFRSGTGFDPKPAWHSLVRFTGGSASAPPGAPGGGGGGGGGNCPLPPPLPCL